MHTKFALALAFATLIAPSAILEAQDRIATRPVVNIFSLPTKPMDPQEANQAFNTEKKAAPKQKPTDPFADVPVEQENTESLAVPNLEPPSQEKPAIGTTKDDNLSSEDLQLSDMPLNVDPFTDEPQEDLLMLEDLPPPAMTDKSDSENLPPAIPHSATPGVSWINLQAPLQPQSSGSSYKPKHNRGLRTASMRRPAPPTPTISVFQPAIIHVPVPIKVIPTYFDYPYLPYYPAYYQPRQAPKPVYDSSQYYGNHKSRAEAANDYSYYPATDQKLKQNQDPNLVGFDSRSVNYVGYPLNYFSRPTSNHYGVHIQSFPVTRRMDR